MMLDPCKVPPSGWICTRVAGHDGPCAAVPLRKTDDAITQARMMGDVIGGLTRSLQALTHSIIDTATACQRFIESMPPEVAKEYGLNPVGRSSP